MARSSELIDLTRRLAASARTDDVTGLAAEIAYRSFLELFPFFVFLASIGGALESSFHVQNPAHQILDLLTNSMPQGAADPIRQQLEGVLGSQQGLVGLPMLGVLWLFAGSGATLLKAMNRIYEIEETRPFWERYLVGLWLTLLGGSVLALVILMMSAVQMLGRQAGGDAAPGWFWPIASFLRWPVLLAILIVEAGVVFRVAPNSKPSWRFITPGALLFAVGWLLASALFVFYVDKTGGYAGTYGVLGGVIVLLLWLQLTAFALLLGAELNDLLEHPAEDRQRAQISKSHGSRARQELRPGSARGSAGGS
jgi:membrane protein